MRNITHQHQKNGTNNLIKIDVNRPETSTGLVHSNGTLPDSVQPLKGIGFVDENNRISKINIINNANVTVISLEKQNKTQSGQKIKQARVDALLPPDVVDNKQQQQQQQQQQVNKTNAIFTYDLMDSKQQQVDIKKKIISTHQKV